MNTNCPINGFTFKGDDSQSNSYLLFLFHHSPREKGQVGIGGFWAPVDQRGKASPPVPGAPMLTFITSLTCSVVGLYVDSKKIFIIKTVFSNGFCNLL